MNRASPSARIRSGMRGQPLLVLVAVLAGWGTLRATTWDMPVASTEHVAALVQIAADRISVMPVVQPAEAGQGMVSSLPAPPPVPAAPGSFADPAMWLAVPPQPVLPTIGSGMPEAAITASVRPAANPVSRPVTPPSRQRLAAGHAMLMVAGFAQMQIPPEIAAYFSRATLPGTSEMPANAAPTNVGLVAPSVPAAAPALIARSPATASQPRWSADGWLMWRDDTTTPITSGNPSYGRSQLGAVARYELAPGSRQRPQAYLRGSAALQGAAEQDVAAGLSARPLAGLPLRLAAEVRASDRSNGREVRAAAFVVTELAPQQLPGGLVAEVYAQAGYVGGRDATAFVDGQARVDRSLGTAGEFDLRAGAAAWGGAQDEGARIDVGPTAAMTFRVGQARGRLAADYRFRVAGDAQPASGPALTLSAGF